MYQIERLIILDPIRISLSGGGLGEAVILTHSPHQALEPDRAEDTS